MGEGLRDLTPEEDLSLKANTLLLGQHWQTLDNLSQRRRIVVGKKDPTKVIQTRSADGSITFTNVSLPNRKFSATWSPSGRELRNTGSEAILILSKGIERAIRAKRRRK